MISNGIDIVKHLGYSLTMDDRANTVGLVEDVYATLREFAAVLEHETVPHLFGLKVLATSRCKLVDVADLVMFRLLGKLRTQSADVVDEPRKTNLVTACEDVGCGREALLELFPEPLGDGTVTTADGVAKCH
jgi:hypothetical protein